MKKTISFAIAISAIFVIMLPWATAPSASETILVKNARLGLWSLKDSVWVHSRIDSVLSPSTIYIPPEKILNKSTPQYVCFINNEGKENRVAANNLTGNPVKTEMWGKLLIKAEHGGYPYLYDFLNEVICRTYGESAPLVMNDLYNNIMLAFAYRGQFPASTRGIWYCLQYYTELKLAGRVPINDLDGENRLVELGRPSFRLPLLSRSQVYHMQTW